MAPGFNPGPTTPEWGCPGCGCSDNWHSRTSCRLCNHRAPAHVVQTAAKAASGKGSQPAASAW
eukprot:10630454-Heterocapsa_arctica.AAC.1